MPNGWFPPPFSETNPPQNMVWYNFCNIIFTCNRAEVRKPVFL